MGRKISSKDTLIRSRLQQVKSYGIDGLIRKDDRFTVYVMNWETILSRFELDNDYLLQHLRLKRLELEGSSRMELLGALTGQGIEGEETPPFAPEKRASGPRKREASAKRG